MKLVMPVNCAEFSKVCKKTITLLIPGSRNIPGIFILKADMQSSEIARQAAAFFFSPA
jgi:hypothetical protein